MACQEYTVGSAVRRASNESIASQPHYKYDYFCSKRLKHNVEFQTRFWSERFAIIFLSPNFRSGGQRTLSHFYEINVTTKWSNWDGKTQQKKSTSLRAIVVATIQTMTVCGSDKHRAEICKWGGNVYFNTFYISKLFRCWQFGHMFPTFALILKQMEVELHIGIFHFKIKIM